MKTNKANGNSRKNTKTSTTSSNKAEITAVQLQEIEVKELSPETDTSAEKITVAGVEPIAVLPEEGIEAETVVQTAEPVALLPVVTASSPLVTINGATLPIELVDIHRIVESPNNPRKNLDKLEPGLLELADNIKSVGILQPVCVRPINGGMLEIVYGHRRFWAAQYADLTSLPVIVREMSDEEAEDLAITENLQREDVTPLDEAAAFKRALATKRHKIEALVAKFGKSESYIRARLKLNDLIEEMADLLDKEEINIGVAIEVAKYEPEVQREVYEMHFKDDDSYSWKNVRIKEIAKRLYDQYMTQLDRFNFDKSECQKCGNNTMNQVLFKECVGECGACQNQECMFTKNVNFLRDKAIQMLKDDPRTMIAVMSNFSTPQVIESLEEQGYEIKCLPVYSTSFIDAPEPPEAVDADAYEDEEEYNEALKDYNESMVDFKAKYADFEYAIKEGRIRKYALVENRDVRIAYEEIEEEVVATDEVDEEGRQVYVSIAPEPPIEALKRQDRIARTNYVREVYSGIREVVRQGKVTRANLKQEEKKIALFALLKKEIPNTRFKELGFELNHSHDVDPQYLAAVDGFTPQHFNMVLRMYIQSYLSNVVVPTLEMDDVEMKLLEEFAEQNYKKEVDEIRASLLAEYEKKHQKFLEQIEANERLEAQTTAVEDPDEEPEMIPDMNPEPEPEDCPFLDDPTEPAYIPIEPDNEEQEMLTTAA